MEKVFLLQSLLFCSAFTVNLWSTLPKDTFYKKAIEMPLHSENVRMCSQMLLSLCSLSQKTCLLFVSDEHRDQQRSLKTGKQITSFKVHFIFLASTLTDVPA